MSANQKNMSGAEPSGIDEKRRMILKLTLGGAAAFATPLIVSFSLEGLQAQTLVCHPYGAYGAYDPYVNEAATALIDAEGNLVVTVSAFNCASEDLQITATADVEVAYGCRNRAGHFPLGHDRILEATVEETIDGMDSDDFEVTVTLHPPPAPACPPGLTPAKRAVAYRDIQVIIWLGGSPFEVQVSPSDLSRTF